MQNEYDIAVIGGGLSGFGCALKAAWNGKRVLLVERRPALGWESTSAGQLNFSGANSHVAQRILDEISTVGGLRDNIADAPILEMALDRVAQEAKVSVLLYSYPVRLIFEGETAFGVILGSWSGEQIIKAKVIVDATEEALLWSQTDVRVRTLEEVPARQVLFLNHAEEEMELPLDLGREIVLLPSVWKGEVRVEFGIGKWNPLIARRKMPQIIEHIRREVPQLKDALVSHVGNEPFPAAPPVAFEERKNEHPKLKNFFAAGIWAVNVENSPAGRLSLGEEIGEIASKCEGPKEFPKEMMAGSLFSQPEITSDVLIVGGGTGGSLAAIAAGREGVKTTLIEASSSLGGIGTGGAIHWYCTGISGGLQDEVDSRVQELTPLFAGKWEVYGFHPEAKKLALQEMAENAGVEILLNTTVTGVLLKGGKVQTTAPGIPVAIPEHEEERNELLGVLAATPTGVSVYGAKVFIDSTGDGHVAAMCGAPFIIGRNRDNLTHTFSQPAGTLDSKKGTLHFFNFDAGYVNPTDVEDLTRARRAGIQLYWREKFTDQTRLLYIAPLIGLRQGRQVIGEYQLTLADQIAGSRFDDTVSFMEAFYDNHGFDYENESDQAALWVWALGNWAKTIGCEVPYRCLLPKNVDGLLIACRALSLTYDAHLAFRMQRDIQRIGEVAGLAAAQAVKQSVLPREVDVKKLQAILKATGILDERYRPKPAIPESWTVELPDPSALNSEEARELIWLSAHKEMKGVAVLKEFLKSEDQDVRFGAEAALALVGSNEGVSELLRYVEERSEEIPEWGFRMVPRWQAAIPFLGMSRDKKGVPVLIGVLKDAKAPLDALIAAVRALDRIGDTSAIAALHELLKRENIPTERTLGVAAGNINPAVEDARWQLELAVVEALASLGAPADEVRSLIQSYLNDPRAYVQRYASKILQESRVLEKA